MTKIVKLPISKYVDTKFREYSVYILTQRGIPSFYDALTPVQRYILMNSPLSFHKTLSVVGKSIEDGYSHGDKSLTGGISKSRVWCETIANIFNCTVILILGEGAALGAAIHAAWTYFPKKTMSELADQFIQIDKKNKIEPNPQIVDKYLLFIRLYIAISRKIRGLSGENPFNLFAKIQE